MTKVCNIIGVFPPPYGGATVKCKLFNNLLQNSGYKTKIIDIYEASRNKYKIFLVILECMKVFHSDTPIVYCLDSKRLRAVMMLQNLFGNSLKRTTVLVIGGVFHQIITEYPTFEKKLKKVKSLWVETEGMKKKLTKMGFANIEVFPNPKLGDGCCEPKLSNDNDPLRLVFFSQISKEKGVRDIIKLIELLDADKTICYEMDFYGHIVPEIKKEFDIFVQKSENVNYCGVFDSTTSNVYKKLNEYDLLLFPTHWKCEGIPGILVEAKMAGLTIIASDLSYNSEIVQTDKEEGFLIRGNYAEEMYEIVRMCASDRKLLYKLKCCSYQSRKRYELEYFEHMISKI